MKSEYLAVARLAPDADKWELLASEVDPASNVISAQTDSLGTFMLVENAALWSERDGIVIAAEVGDDIIIDELDDGFRHFQDGDGRWGDIPGGWAGHAYWTYNRSPHNPGNLSDPVDWGTWTPSLPEPGYYSVYAWIPASTLANTTGAEYEIHHAGEVDTVVVNQATAGGLWKNLSAYYFDADGSEHVLLDDVVPEKGVAESQIGFDAIKFVYEGQTPPPPADLEPPVIHSVDRWLNGSGQTVIRAEVTDNVAVGEVVLIFNGTSITMESIGGDLYEASADVPSDQTSDFQIVAVDTSGNVTTFPPGTKIDVRGYQSWKLGSHRLAEGQYSNSCNPGTEGCSGDPVSTVTGNFTYNAEDLSVSGIGDTDIVLSRHLNSLPAEPEGVIRYSLDGDTLQAEPDYVHPEPFGPGWSFSYGVSLLVMDNVLLKGVQVRYADGHTMNFTDNGDGTFTPKGTRVYDTLVAEGDGYLLRKKDLTEYHFNGEGRLARITDPNGNALDFFYDGDRLERMVNAAGRWVRFAYDGRGRITDVYAPESIHLRYGYEDGLLRSFTNARGKTTTYGYDSEGRLVSVTTPEGRSAVRVAYEDPLGRGTEQILGEGESYTFTYDDDNRTTTITDAYGETETHYYDEKGRLVEERNAEGNSEYYGYNERDNRTYFKDRAGNEWFYTFDDRGNRLTQSGPLDAYTEFEYNELDLVTAIRVRIDEERFQGTTFDYDKQGNLIEVCNALKDCSTFEYDDRGLPTDVWDFARRHTINEYDAEGDLIAVTNAENETTEFRHDGLGRVVEMETPLGPTYTYGYDPSGNLVSVDGPLGYHLGYGYDGDDNLETEIDPNGGTVHYVYDRSDNVVEVENQLGFTAVYTYGLMNELTGYEDLQGRVWSYEHDSLLRTTDVYGPLDTLTHMEYDEVGNVTDVTDPEGHITHLEYDALRRVTSTTLNYLPGEPEGADVNLTTYYEYDLLDNVVREVDPEGNLTEFQYDLLGRLERIEDAEERVWAYAYDPMDNLTLETNPREYSTAYEYDGAYRLKKVIDANGKFTTFLYDDNGNLTDEVDAEGMVTHYVYNELDRPIQEIRNYLPGEDEDARTNVTTEYEYDPAGNLRFVTEPRDYVARFVYDAAHRLTDAYDYEGAHSHFEYDRVDNLLSVTDDNDHTTYYGYDDLDRRISIVNPEGDGFTFTYDKVGNLTELVDANGNPTTYEVDALGRVVRMIDALEGEWSYEYDRVGNVLKEIDANRHPTTYTYDDAYRLRTVTDAENITTRFRWDANGNLVEYVDGNGHSTEYEYDELDRLAATVNPEKERTEYRYDALGNQTRLIEADDTVTAYGYDPLYRLNSVTENYVPGEPADNDTNVVTRYVYDASGNLATLTNAKGAETTFEYDGMGRVVREEDPLHNVWEYTYDGVGNRLTRLDAKRDLTEYTYYSDDQLKRVDYAGESFVEYAYDPNNNRTSMEDSLGTMTWAYDALGRVTDVVDPFNRALHYEYDRVGNRVGMRYPDGNVVAYTYYRNDWLKTMVDPKGGITFYDRDGVGNITRMVYPNSTVTEITYDKADRVQTMANRQIVGAQKTNSAFNYTYNEVGHVTQTVSEYAWRKPDVITETYGYDGLHRLVSMEDSEGVVMSYAYDAVGNRLTWSSNDDLTTQTPFDGFHASYTYNAANQLTDAVIDSEKPNGDLTVAFTYDANGNRVDKLVYGKNGPEYGTAYSYDPENRLVEAQEYQVVDHGNRIDRAITTLAYDGGGRRLVKSYDPKVGGGGEKRVEYVFDGLDPVAEYEMLNGQQENFYRGAGNRIVSMHNFRSGTLGQMYWYHYNFKGDVVGLTKHHGQSHHNYRYDPYGQLLPSNGNFTDPHNHYTLTGKEWDENTELYYFGARHYEPETGVWVTQDTYRGYQLEPDTLHRYLYVGTNPVSFIDAYGYRKIDEAKEFWSELGANLKAGAQMLNITDPAARSAWKYTAQDIVNGEALRRMPEAARKAANAVDLPGILEEKAEEYDEAARMAEEDGMKGYAFLYKALGTAARVDSVVLAVNPISGAPLDAAKYTAETLEFTSGVATRQRSIGDGLDLLARLGTELAFDKIGKIGGDLIDEALQGVYRAAPDAAVNWIRKFGGGPGLFKGLSGRPPSLWKGTTWINGTWANNSATKKLLEGTFEWGRDRSITWLSNVVLRPDKKINSWSERFAENLGAFSDIAFGKILERLYNVDDQCRP